MRMYVCACVRVCVRFNVCVREDVPIYVELPCVRVNLHTCTGRRFMCSCENACARVQGSSVC